MTRADVRHLAANRVSIMCGHAQLIANDPRCHPILKAKAELIDREARRLLEELMALFVEPDAHLGANRD